MPEGRATLAGGGWGQGGCSAKSGGGRGIIPTIHSTNTSSDMGRRPTLSRADNEQTEGVTSQRGVDMRRSSPRLFTTNIAVMLLVLLCPRTAEGTSSPAPDRHGRPHALDLDDIPVDPDRRTCPPESLSNMRLLMETRFDSLGADKLADLLARHSSPQTKQLFGRDVEMLRALLSVAATSSMSDGPPPSTNTAVLWTVYQRQQQTHRRT